MYSRGASTSERIGPNTANPNGVFGSLALTALIANQLAAEIPHKIMKKYKRLLTYHHNLPVALVTDPKRQSVQTYFSP